MKRSSKYVKQAHEHRSTNDYLQAGEYYSVAGHAYLATAWDSIRSSELGPTRQGGLLEAFVWQEYATVCYILADHQCRAVNRAEQAILGLEDVRTCVLDHPVWIGLTWELVGDFRVLAGLPESDGAYGSALAQYSDFESSTTEGDVLGWITEPGFNETILFLLDVARGVDVTLEIQKMRTRDGHPSLIEHLEYKREHLAGLREQLLAQGEWRRTERDLPTVEDVDGGRNDRGSGADR